MTFANRIGQVMHDEHDATIALMARLRQVIAQYPKGSSPDTDDLVLTRLLTDLSAAIESELNRHFLFEEKELFSYLTVYGDEAIATHLMDEHVAIRRVGSILAVLAREGRVRGFDMVRWAEFRRHSRGLCDLLEAHVQKEETALLPAIDELMDSETEMRLYEKYAEAE